MPEHTDFDVYTPYCVKTSGDFLYEVTHITCGVRILESSHTELGTLMRACYTHTQVCPVVNSAGSHSALY
jgi:hypothetical protein